MSHSNFEIAQLIDLSAVRAEVDEQTIRALVDAARKYQCHLGAIRFGVGLRWIDGIMTQVETPR